MADLKSTERPADHPFDVALTSARQLEALLCCTYGEAAESFRNLADDQMESFLWCCGDLSSRIVAALDALAAADLAREAEIQQ